MAERAREPAPRPPMTPAHKEALARGRADGRVVRRYLEALDARRRRPGRRRTPQSIARRLAAVHDALPDADPLARLHLLQERSDLEAALARSHTAGDGELTELEEGFVAVAKAYGERKSIGYRAWRAAGVDAEVLARAGIRPTRSPRGATPGAPPRRSPR